MSTLKKATIKSTTFWINTLFAAAGTAAVGLGSSVDPQTAQNAAMTITPETIGTIAAVLGAPISAQTMGTITIVMAFANQLLRYKTQRAHEKQPDGQ